MASRAALEVIVGGFNVGEPNDYRIPDVGLVRGDDDELYYGTAALAVEVISPGDETWNKLDFYAALFDRVQKLKRRGPVFVMGDYNTAHEAIDLARPKTNEKTSGFLPEERAEMSRWVKAGWIDTFRARHPGEEGHYTWWRQWGGAREKNVGWRIDYVLASPSGASRVRDAFIWKDVPISGPE